MPVIQHLLLDGKGKAQLLSKLERRWVLGHLKKIDDTGYKEYSFLQQIFEELKKGNRDIAASLESTRQFINYVRSWSRKAKQEKKLKNQVANVAAMFAQSKIPLLRELGVISNKRNDYTIIGEWK